MSISDAAQPDWDIPRSPATCRHLLEAAQLQGIDAQACLKDSGLGVADIEDNATEVQAGQELRIVRNVLARVEDRHRFACDVGLRYNVANMGVLGYALLASPTLGDAVNVACRYAALSSTFHRLARRDSAQGAVLEFDNSAVPADVRAFMLERDMFAVTGMAPLLIGQLDSSIRLDVELAGTAFPMDRLDLPWLNIDFNPAATSSTVTIPAEILELAMPAADAATAKMCARECEELLQARRHRRGVSALVRARLVRDPGQLPSMADIAEELNVAERTLHRRLAAEQTSFRALVDEVRVTLAVALLESGLTVEETGRRLGYSETAAFTRAFLRWTGAPPSRYRGRRA
ncbi:AraC family transcriptional regulator ligand-binding domain-containing protein [Mycolicibacter minnesotensis]